MLPASRSFQREEGQVQRCTCCNNTFYCNGYIIRWRYMSGAVEGIKKRHQGQSGEFLVMPDPGVGKAEGRELAGYARQRGPSRKSLA